MKKVILILIALAIVIGSVVGIKELRSYKTTEQQAKEEVVNKDAAQRPKQALIEDTIRNYRNIYINLVNNNNLDFSFLNNVLGVNTSYYNDVIKEIENKRKQGEKLQSQDLEINEMEDWENGYKVKVKESFVVMGDKKETKIIEGYYIIKIDKNSIKIVDYLK